jgi:hypothetical protein
VRIVLAGCSTADKKRWESERTILCLVQEATECCRCPPALCAPLPRSMLPSSFAPPVSTPVTSTRRQISICEATRRCLRSKSTLHTYVSSVLGVSEMQVFYIDVAKLDRDITKVVRDVAHVAMIKYTCCKYMFQVF